jgi:putative transposase
MICQASHGVGKALTGRRCRHRWHKRPWVRIRPVGEENGSKRPLLVAARGVPLSILVTGANRHDARQLGAVLARQKMKYPPPVIRRNKHLCADAGYRGAASEAVIERDCYIPHLPSRRQERPQRARHPYKRTHRWIVEVAHSGFNRFRKPLVRQEKFEGSCMALHPLAAAIIGFRKIPAKVNLIYG